MVILEWSIDERKRIVDDFKKAIDGIANQFWRGLYSENWPRIGAAFAAETKVAKRAVIIRFIFEVISSERNEGFDVDMTAHHAVNFIKACGTSFSYAAAVEVFATNGRKSSDKSNLKTHIARLSEKYADSLHDRLKKLDQDSIQIRRDAIKIIRAKLTKDAPSGYVNSSSWYQS